LAGICGALLALGRSLKDERSFDASVAARLAVCAHGEAADRAAAALGERGLLATDLLLWLPALLSGSDLIAGKLMRRAD
jgi:ADP-dependent NAD(P)H-hydrate dehydratase / NAD(P)H-hydrate epimerase